jgi:1,4-dihydroxy-2-naphthoyl-CoA hydrolase
MFKYQTSVKLHDTDAAGLLFFANQFNMAHDAYETFMSAHGVSFYKILHERDYKLAIVHASAEYLKQLSVGDPLTVEMRAEKVSTHSFILAYDLLGEDGTKVGSARTVHVCIDSDSGEKKALPDEVRSAMEQIRK